MTKKQNKDTEENQRLSRKEVLLSRKEKEQNRSVYLGVGIVAAVLVALFLIAIIIELFVTPNRVISEVRGEEITLNEWIERTRFERAQRIIFLEDQMESFNDVGLIQQFYGQVINDLMQPDLMGDSALATMEDDIVVLQAAQERGITVSDAEVDEAVGEIFSYYGGASPTPFPTATQTIVPTPSITPIPTMVITDVLPTNTPFPTATVGPTSTAAPTPTAVSAEAFQTDFQALMARYEAYGVSESQYRELIRLQLYRDKLADALATENNLPVEAEHASFFYISIATQEDAERLQADILEKGYVQVWNEVRSTPANPETPATMSASEVLWRAETDITPMFGAEVATAVFTGPLNESSDILVNSIDETNSVYYLVMPTGREVRPLTEAVITQAKNQALVNFIDAQLTGNVVTHDIHRGRAPETPRLDPIFYSPLTPTPAVTPATDQ